MNVIVGFDSLPENGRYFCCERVGVVVPSPVKPARVGGQIVRGISSFKYMSKSELNNGSNSSRKNEKRN